MRTTGTGVRNLIPRFALTIAVLLCASACRSGSNPASSKGAASGVSGLDQFDPVQYYDLWNGDLALPGAADKVVAKVDWLRVVSDARASGITSLSEDDRAILMQGAIKAYLVEVNNTERTMLAPGIKSEIREFYGLEDNLHVTLRAREQTSTDTQSSWPDELGPGSGSIEMREFVDVSGQQTSVQEWTRENDGSWSCEQRIDSGEGIAFARSFYYQRLAGTVLGGKPVRRATYSGRAATLFEVPHNPVIWREWWTIKRSFRSVWSFPDTLDHRNLSLIEKCGSRPSTADRRSSDRLAVAR